MSRKQKLKIIIDLLLTVFLLLLMPYGMVGEAAHEWIGVGMLLLFIIHHILNRKWLRGLAKGRYTPLRILQTTVVFLILAGMIGSAVSGMILSSHVFDFLDIRGFSAPARVVHMLSAYWGFVLMALHLGFHWGMITGMMRRAFPEPSPRRTGIARIVAAAIACYGCYAFIKRDIFDYMFLRTHFVFFDYSEPLVFFILDYVAVMGMFVFIGYYLCRGLAKSGRKREK